MIKMISEVTKKKCKSNGNKNEIYFTAKRLFILYFSCNKSASSRLKIRLNKPISTDKFTAKKMKKTTIKIISLIKMQIKIKVMLKIMKVMKFVFTVMKGTCCPLVDLRRVTLVEIICDFSQITLSEKKYNLNWLAPDWSNNDTKPILT